MCKRYRTENEVMRNENCHHEVSRISLSLSQKNFRREKDSKRQKKEKRILNSKRGSVKKLRMSFLTLPNDIGLDGEGPPGKEA